MSSLEIFGVTFVYPLVLLLLLLIPPLMFLKGRVGGTAGVQFSSTVSLAEIGRQRKSRSGAFLAALTQLGLACMIVALARPQLGREITHVQASGIDIMLVIDVSRSMLAEDFSIGGQRANRLETLKQVTQQFIEGRPNDRIGIVAFAGRPYLVSPLTLDHNWLIENLDRIRIGLVEDGTAIGQAVASAANRLKDKEAKSKLIVLMTDGENNAGRVMPLTAAEAARALGIRIYAIGAGTRGTAPYPLTDQFGRTFYRDIPVEFNEDTLKQISSITNGEYFRATDTKSLEAIFEKIDQLEKSKVEVEKVAQYRDLFEWFLIAGFSCLSFEIILSQTLWKRLP